MALAHPSPQDRSRAPLAAWLAAGAGLCLVYAFIFVATEQTAPGEALLIGTGNVAPLMVLTAGLWLVLPRWVAPRAAMAQGLWHAGLAITFTLAWYVASRVSVAGAAALLGLGFHPSLFAGPALAWQIFQGLGLYAAVAAAFYALNREPGTQVGAGALASPPRPLDRYLIRAGEDFHPVAVGDIVTITGAQDYSEVATPAGRHLVRLSLADFEQRLDPARFIRVHRSTIIHLAHLERAELAGGGRMLAHMSNGERVPVSRTGVKALRPLIV